MYMNNILRTALCIAVSIAASSTQSGIMSLLAEKPELFKTLNGDASLSRGFFLLGQLIELQTQIEA